MINHYNYSHFSRLNRNYWRSSLAYCEPAWILGRDPQISGDQLFWYFGYGRFHVMLCSEKYFFTGKFINKSSLFLFLSLYVYLLPAPYFLLPHSNLSLMPTTPSWRFTLPACYALPAEAAKRELRQQPQPSSARPLN